MMTPDQQNTRQISPVASVLGGRVAPGSDGDERQDSAPLTVRSVDGEVENRLSVAGNEGLVNCEPLVKRGPILLTGESPRNVGHVDHLLPCRQRAWKRKSFFHHALIRTGAIELKNPIERIVFC